MAQSSVHRHFHPLQQHLDARLASNPTPITLLERLAVAAAHAEHEFRVHSTPSPTILVLHDSLISLGHEWAGSSKTASTAIAPSIRTRLSDIAIRRFAFATNRPAAHRLPRLIRIHIAHHLDLWDRVMLARANRAFRNALLAESTLWNRIGVPLPLGFSAEPYWRCANALLSRAIHVSECITPSIHIHARQLLDPRPYANYMRDTLYGLLQIASTLRIDLLPFWAVLDEPYGWRQQHGMLWSLICQEAPSLERLSLTIPYTTPQDCPPAILPQEFLAQNAGCLTSLSLQYIHLRDDMLYPAFRGLRKFNYNPGTFNTPVESLFLWGALDNMPQLEYFGLANAGFILNALQPTVHHDNLHEVVVECISSGLEDLVSFFAHVPKIRCHHSPIASMALYDRWPDGDISLTMYQGQVLVRPNTPDPAYTFTVWETIGLSPAGVRYVSVGIPAVHATRIVSLSMRNEQWDEAYNLPPLPRLHELTIIIGACHSHPSNFAGTWWSFMDPQGKVPQWQKSLPSLHQVCLFSGVRRAESRFSTHMGELPPWPPTCERKCCCDKGCIIFLRDVTDFVRSFQLADGQRLSRLLLCGFNSFADVEPGAEMCELLKLVREVEGSEASMPDEFMTVSSGATMRELLSDTKLAREIRSTFDGMSLPGFNQIYSDLDDL